MRKFIFLDFDGVLNNEQWAYDIHDTFKGDEKFSLLSHKRPFDPKNVANLNYIIRLIPDVKFIISSAWRFFMDLDEIADKFKREGVLISRDMIYGKTPHLDKRSVEIRNMLSELSDRGEFKYVAVDDMLLDSDIISVKTEFRTGLRREHAKQAVLKLED